MRIVLLVISLGAFAVHSAVGVSDSQSSDDRNIQIVEEAKDDMFDEQAANDDFVDGHRESTTSLIRNTV